MPGLRLNIFIARLLHTNIFIAVGGAMKNTTKNTCLTNTIFSSPTKIRLTNSQTVPIYETTQHKHKGPVRAVVSTPVGTNHRPVFGFEFWPPTSSIQDRNNTHISQCAKRGMSVNEIDRAAQILPQMGAAFLVWGTNVAQFA